MGADAEIRLICTYGDGEATGEGYTSLFPYSHPPEMGSCLSLLV